MSEQEKTPPSGPAKGQGNVDTHRAQAQAKAQQEQAKAQQEEAARQAKLDQEAAERQARAQEERQQQARQARAERIAAAKEQARQIQDAGSPEAAAAQMSAGRGHRLQGKAFDQERAPGGADPVAMATAIQIANQQIEMARLSQVATPDMDRTIPGGLYVVEGKTVNAFGDEISVEDDEEA